MERLGYGTHLSVDAFQAQRELLGDEAAVRRLLAELATVIESNCEDEFLEQVIRVDDGYSVARLCSESQLFIHLFPDSETLYCRVFTRRNASLGPLVEKLRDHFQTGRFQSHLSSVSKVAEHDEEAVRRMLHGDRRYSQARFDAVINGP